MTRVQFSDFHLGVGGEISSFSNATSGTKTGVFLWGLNDRGVLIIVHCFDVDRRCFSMVLFHICWATEVISHLLGNGALP